MLGGGGWGGLTGSLEVPGQYDMMAFGAPRPDLHAHIASVGPDLLQLGSKMKPKRITFQGNDEREYQVRV